MNRTVAVMAGLALGALVSPHSIAAQVAPPRLRFSPPAFSLLLQPHSRLLVPPQALFRAPQTATVECPMPVAVPDLGGVERMPVARVDTTGHFIRIAPIPCVNPLGPQSAPLPTTAVPRPPAPRLPPN